MNALFGAGSSMGARGAPGVAVSGVRGLSLAVWLRAAAALAPLGVLGACGGSGGSGGATPGPPLPPPAPAAPIAAQLAVPAPVGYDADRLAAFNRLNEIRLSAGLGMLAQSAAMDRAAQAHADWIIANDSFTHEEVPGTLRFTAVNWWERDEAMGYVPTGGSEGMVGLVHGARGVDALVNGPYHRAGLLAFEPVDVGIGWSALAAASISMPLVIDMARPGSDAVRGAGQAAQPRIDGVALWPVDGATGVPMRLGLESPNPVPSQDVHTLGTPPSITVDPLLEITVSAFTLTNVATGVVLPTVTLSYRHDPNGVIPAAFAAAIPLAPLSPDTTFVASFSGRSTGIVTGEVTSINRTWSFTTGSE